MSSSISVPFVPLYRFAQILTEGSSEFIFIFGIRERKDLLPSNRSKTNEALQIHEKLVKPRKFMIVSSLIQFPRHLYLSCWFWLYNCRFQM